MYFLHLVTPMQRHSASYHGGHRRLGVVPKGIRPEVRIIAPAIRLIFPIIFLSHFWPNIDTEVRILEAQMTKKSMLFFVFFLVVAGGIGTAVSSCSKASSASTLGDALPSAVNPG